MNTIGKKEKRSRNTDSGSSDISHAVMIGKGFAGE